MEVMQRQKYILDQLNQRGTIKIAEISKEINVSRETIRKDIYNLVNFFFPLKFHYIFLYYLKTRIYTGFWWGPHHTAKCQRNQVW